MVPEIAIHAKEEKTLMLKGVKSLCHKKFRNEIAKSARRKPLPVRDIVCNKLYRETHKEETENSQKLDTTQVYN